MSTQAASPQGAATQAAATQVASPEVASPEAGPPEVASSQGPAVPGVQSVHRALDLLEILAAAGGRLPMAELAARAQLPTPTVHRLLRTMVERGYLRQLPDRSYALGFRLVPLGARANAMVGANASGVLHDLVAELGETANLAVLSGDQAEYVAQAPSRYAMRMFTEVGRRVDLHSTGVGKVLLAQLDDDEALGIIRSRGLPRYTAHTVGTETALRAELRRIRERGFALDEQEQEIGVRCVAIALDPASAPGVAVSVSGPTARMTDELVERAVGLLRAAASRLAGDLRD
ncbi:IclR family transcriptional regulator [Parafrankia sp. BMG5.11]|uniref:IclR family transcriptional regulator n=1 Tax=Parafrankia sp. BMG5.11 TaxID=222540 RepID=UPI001FB282E9|nr:IclR family transcriptional regulator [Parafrankia sp. BMG5.11]